MKYKTFAAIRTGAFIGIPVIALVVLIRSCSTSEHTDQASPDGDMATQQAMSKQRGSSTSSNEKPRYGEQELALSDIEREILGLQKDPISLGKEDDNGSIKRTVRKGSIKLDIRCDKNKGFSSWNRIKVDWDNNGKYDEKWNFRQNGTVARFVSPSDDEDYSMEYRLDDSKWTRK